MNIKENLSTSNKGKSMKKLLSTIAIAAFLSLQTACDDSSSTTNTPTNSPLVNGTNERSLVVVISDIHMGADIAYAEINKNLTHLQNFLEQVRVSPNVKELIIGGDLLDEWFVPAGVDTYQGKDQKDFVKRIATTNKIAIDVLNQIITDKKILVTYVPGNHDLTITAENVNEVFPGINQARDEGKIGLGTYSSEFLPALAVEHGHRFNFFCAPDPFSNSTIAPGSITPPGYFFTRLATEHVVQKCTTSADVVKSVTILPDADLSQQNAFKYWKMWAMTANLFPINNMFDEKIFVTNVDGFTEKYAVNDFMPYQDAPGGTINMKLFSNIQNTWEARQTANNVAVHIDVVRAIDSVSSAQETNYQAKVQYFTNTNSDKRIVVFGHSHIATIEASLNNAGQKCIYANSGTWVDNLKKTYPTTANFVVITPQNSNATSQTVVKLYNFENGVYNFMKADSLRF